MKACLNILLDQIDARYKDEFIPAKLTDLFIKIEKEIPESKTKFLSEVKRFYKNCHDYIKNGRIILKAQLFLLGLCCKKIWHGKILRKQYFI